VKQLKNRNGRVVVGVVILVIIALCAVVVYLDASTHEIGDISKYGSSFNKSAIYWAVATLFIWPYAFPYYLRIRRKLIEAATEHPVQEDWLILKASLVALVAVGFVAVSVAFPG
jgi:Kef-type K+ transport system membrane component KefB